MKIQNNVLNINIRITTGATILLLIALIYTELLK